MGVDDSLVGLAAMCCHIRREQVIDCSPSQCVAFDAEALFELSVEEEESALGVLDDNDARRIIDDRLEQVPTLVEVGDGSTQRGITSLAFPNASSARLVARAS